MRKPVRRWLVAVLAAFSLLATALPAEATVVSINKGGCTGYGVSAAVGANTYGSATDVNPGTYCTYFYLDCYWQLQAGGVYHGCPGWVTTPPGPALPYTIGVSSYHTLCEIGPPQCSGSYPALHTTAGTFYG